VRILILSFYFAPQNTMAAHRLTRLAAYLREQGHEVRVVAARVSNVPTDPDGDAGDIMVVRTWVPSLDLPALLQRSLQRLRLRRKDEGIAAGLAQAGPVVRFGRRLVWLYRDLLFWPDEHMGWFLSALPLALRLCRQWRPDAIYASSPPATTLALACALRRLCGVPWVAEIRDRWADDPYTSRPGWRWRLEHRLEDIILSSAHGLVTVSQTWAEFYGTRYRVPTAVVYNGFDPDAYCHADGADGETGVLRIVYTGSVYAGRDPAPLWQALGAMGNDAEAVRVEFYGAKRSEVLPGAARHGVAHLVTVQEYVAHVDAVRLQCGADILLMLQWDNPSEAGNLPGKLFEYLGARRPVLALGYDGGEMARIIRERGAGLFANDPQEIARQLRGWIETKRRADYVAALPESATAGYTRQEQYQQLLPILYQATHDLGSSRIR
jgi:glycosyltransferase involved in cell wall biosynthesis